MSDGASPLRTRRIRRRIGIVVLTLVSALAVLVLILVLVPAPRPENRPVPLSRTEAEAAYAQLITDDRADGSLWPECVPIDLPPRDRRLPVAVIVGGLSGGATMALWLGTRRPDLERVVLVAPFLSPRIVPTPLSAAAGHVSRYFPNLRVRVRAPRDVDQGARRWRI